jgi:hypothetical protein
MNYKVKQLLDKLIEHYGGKYNRINNRLFWEAPNGQTYHVSSTFAKRMVLNYKENQKNGIFSTRPQEVESVEEKKETPQESPKKKKDRPKKTNPEMEIQKEPGEDNVNPLKQEDDTI